MMSRTNSPSPRTFSYSASVEDKVYLWGGDGDTEPEAVFIYNAYTETWTKRLTEGPHPPAGLRNGGCCMAGQHFYLYGGYVDTALSGTLYQLNTDSWAWTELSQGAAGGPGKKNGCKMVSFQDQLLVIGGAYSSGEEPVSVPPGATYVRGYTNEAHSYCLSTGEGVVICSGYDRGLFLTYSRP